MREIIYIQAGKLANYTGTHFWNTQEAYFPYGDNDPESSESEVDTRISFSESVDEQERTTLYPRALIFDAKVNFGTLAAESITEDDAETSAIWSGNLVEYRQEQISKSAYHTYLDEGGEEPEVGEGKGAHAKSDIPEKPLPPSSDTIRYWSDFSRVYYHPRSLQKIGNTLIPEGEGAVVSWEEGQHAFKNYDRENDVMDDALRRLVEDCDNMGGVQILNDTATFGAFTAAFFESFRDEYTKPLSFTFPFFSGPPSDNEDARITKLSLTEAFYLRALKEFSSINVPIHDPVEWCKALGYSPDNIHHRSAIVSALVETSTLPFRLKQCSQDIVSIWAALNLHNNTQFAELGGIFPFTEASDFDRRIYNLSSNLSSKSATKYTHVNVSRGFSSADSAAYENWVTQSRPTQNACYIASVHAPAYTLPSSFPVPLGASIRPPSITQGAPTMKLYSTLTATSNTASTFESYAAFVDKIARQPSSAATAALGGITRDELKELASDLWTMRDGCADDSFED